MNRKWLYLVVLSIIWGTSYILIKKGLEGFTPLQLGAVRIVITSVVLLTLGFRSLRTISGKEWYWVALSGLLGSFLPVFLFAFAETEIDSSIAAILNSLVPLFTILIGFAAFRISFSRNQLVGVLVGLLGAILLIAMGSDINPDQNYWFAGLVVLATIFYACNANIIKSKLQEVSAMGIAVGNIAFMIGPALLLLWYSGALSNPVRQGEYFMSSLGYVMILSIIGTCVAKVMFNRLIQISSPVFSVSVTYLIPVVGIFWGLMDGERFSLWQVFAAGIILAGVYLVNKKRSTSQS
ncbi:DMT family transporter [Muriicola jejuensis]|uniref:DMT family transporter n=1 Tax=Muriicola jejuensis TaxID=504488 RepID=UPI00293BB746|nr:EamA family transporter [Muriicola jejuensis]